VTINTGSVALTVGLQYVLFLSTTNGQPQPSASYKYGALTNNTTYPGGQFVFQNNADLFRYRAVAIYMVSAGKTSGTTARHPNPVTARE
jgi:hypothetical protein